MGSEMKDQHIELLRTVEGAISALADAGDGVDVQVHTVGLRFPDGSNVTFSADEDDWQVTIGGSAP